jgi:type VI secretion system protein VasG
VQQQYQVPVTYDQPVVDLIAARCTEVESGGRMIDAVLSNALLPRMSRELLRRSLDGARVEKVAVAVSEGDFRIVFE